MEPHMRQSLLGRQTHLPSACLSSVVTLLAFSPISDAANGFVDFQVITTPIARSQSPVAMYAAVNTNSELFALYKSQVLASTSSIAFDRFTLLIAGLGVRPNLGYSVVISSVRETGDTTNVQVLEITPGNCPTAEAISYPQTLALIPKTKKQVRFSVSKVTRDCNQQSEIH
jgi:hypothetical protein